MLHHYSTKASSFRFMPLNPRFRDGFIMFTLVGCERPPQLRSNHTALSCSLSLPVRQVGQPSHWLVSVTPMPLRLQLLLPAAAHETATA